MTLDDKDLINLLKELQILNYELGKDVGIVSYNETPLKEIVANGITTISTDFSLMGQRLSEMILNDEYRKLKNPLRVIKRNSL
jgi:DNA-binding LacI/PurR family transcriptional regulator